MSFDKLQSEWQSHEHETPPMVDAELLFQEVRRQHQAMESSLLRRDALEVIAAIFATSVFLGFAISSPEMWSCYVASMACFAVGAFFIIDRWIQRRRQSSADDSLQGCLKNSLDQVNHQIWLLRNMVWWYLLPLFIGIFAVLGSIGWQFWTLTEGELGVVPKTIMAMIIALLLYSGWGVYQMNQRGVRVQLEPRREELEKLLESLQQSS